MTGAEAVALLAGRLGKRTEMTTDIVAELNAAQELKLERAEFLPWFLDKDITTLVTVANQEFIDLPVDFLGFDEETGGLYYNDASGSSDPWIPVAKDFYVNFKEAFRGAAATGDTPPQVFDIIGSRMYFRPIPDSVKTLRMLYKEKQAAVTNDNTTNKWLTYAHDWLLGEAGMVLSAFHTQNPELGGMFATMATAGKMRCSKETTIRREQARSVAMGED